MQLKKVELTGFKSFADRTELAFDGGITAVVGPNGCGKSNVVDAVRWVLGEQSAKSLRAESMGDCIFAGTATRKPLGCAEVTLLFDNSDQTLPLEYDEVAVTRRVYGSGEGQYFINRQPCRLRDIRELFMGTGIGTTAYSIIEQGEVGRIISSDPKELRAVFDEAAGISLYKARLRSAGNKLERVTQNLLRVGDIITEVEKRLRSVKYQAAKARRFREMTVRLRELRLVRARREFETLCGRRDHLRGEIECAEGAVKGFEGDLAAMESRIDAANSRLLDVQAHLEGYSADLKRLEKEADDLSFSIELARERIAHHESNRSRLEETLLRGTRDLEAAEARLIRLERRKDTIEKRTERLGRMAVALDREERRLSEREHELTREIASAEDETVEALRAGAGLNNRVSEIAAEERAAGRHRDRTARRREELTEFIEHLGKGRADLETRRSALAEKMQQRRRRLDGLARLRSSCAAARDEVEKSISRAAGKLRALESRRELLEDLQQRREGVGEAARSLLELELPGMLGLVADLIEVPRHLALPVEKLLGENAAAVVFDKTETALGAVRHLKSSGAGRARIISLERAVAVRHAGVCESFEPVADHVGCSQECAGLVNALLGDCFLAESFDHAVSANGEAAGLRVATPQGDVLERDASIATGGADGAGGLIWRRAEIEGLAADEIEIKAGLEAFEGRRAELANSMAQLDREAEGIKDALSEDAASMAEVHAAASNLDSRISEAGREIAVLESESREIEEEISGFAAERAAVKDKMERMRERSEGLQSRLADFKRERDEVRGRFEDARVRHTRLKVTLASALERESHVSRRWEEAGSALAEKADSLKAASVEIAAAEELAARERRSIEKARLRLETSRREANAARVVLATRSRESRSLRQEISRLAPAVKALRTRLEHARSGLSELCVDQREVSVRLSDLISRAREEMDVSPAELGEPCGEIEDEAALAEEISQLTGKLSSMGGVNMEALEELDELEARHAFLAGQRDDLQEAGDLLQKVIARTRATSRKMFMENFESVRRHFSDIFRRIFGGGKADCVLLDPEDVLESRIQILAKPPGKELSQLTLLSGGEKAMTAVSLLFAMFSTRPSPFLILDEVDAPMDESNIGRFIDLMRDFLPTSQFIVITHSRRTMAAADTLYGITMEEQGVSKKVSVSFRDEAPTLEEVPA